MLHNPRLITNQIVHRFLHTCRISVQNRSLDPFSLEPHLMELDDNLDLGLQVSELGFSAGGGEVELEVGGQSLFGGFDGFCG